MLETPVFKDVLAARGRIAAHIRKTPLLRSEALSARAGVEVFLKLEHQQITGAFKLRGATNAVLSMTPAERARGVVCSSTGNHGKALARACAQFGAPLTVCMSNKAAPHKIAAIRAAGAEIHFAGDTAEAADDAAPILAQERGAAFVSPFDDPRVIAGQGVLGLELVEDAPEIETVISPLSGGGLLGGVGLAMRAAHPNARLIGVSQERGPGMVEALKAGKPVEVEESPTLADALAGGIGLDNRYSFALIRDLAIEPVLVTEEEMAEGVRFAYAEERQIIEGASGTGLGAVLAGKVALTGPTAILLCGGNIDMALHQRIVTGAWSVSELG